MGRFLVDFEKIRYLECGLGQFSLELAQAMLQERRPEDDLHFFLPESRAEQFRNEKVTIKPVRRWQKSTYIGPVRDQLNRVIQGPRYDVWHSSNQCTWYAPWNARVPLVLTIHDLNFLREKTPPVIDSYLKTLQRKIDRATHLTTISQFVAGEIQAHFDLQGKPLRVIYNGAAESQYEKVERPDFAPARGFLFSIGDFTRKKNFHVLVEMLQHLPEYDLVLAGNCQTEYGLFVQQRAVECGVADRLVLPGRISNADRQWLYENCSAFGFPSLTEGFGLPVIEAMKVGKPVFLSTATSLPEVGGEWAFYWPSFEPQEMAGQFRNGMARFDGDPNFSDNVRQHAAQFSWRRAAREYLALYRDIADGRAITDLASLPATAPAAQQSSSPTLSVVIPCCDESQNILQCIESVRGIADEIVVADSGSTDRTLEKVRRSGGCRIVEREFVSFSSFKNWAIQQASHPWVLTLDADERLTPEGAEEIATLLHTQPKQDGYRIPRLNHFLGQPLQYGAAASDRPIRLFRSRQANYENKLVHEGIEIASGKVGQLRQSMLHYSTWSIEEYFARIDRYSTLAAEQMHAAGRRIGFWRMLGCWPLHFFKFYLLKQGFRDGMAGLVYNGLSATAVITRYAKLWAKELKIDRAGIDPQPELEAEESDLRAA